jgi:hypothetical protein
MGFPPVQGLYDPRNEHDACGVGFVAHIKGRKATRLSSRRWKFCEISTIAARWAPTRCWAMAPAS